MGLLSSGTPLPWAESRAYNEHVRTNGIEQLLHIFKAAAGRKDDRLLWGDELEYMLINKDNGKLSIKDDDILELLETLLESKLETTDDQKEKRNSNITYHPEYGRFMLESTPRAPYNLTKEYSAYSYVEKNMAMRKEYAKEELDKRNIVASSLTVYPRMGCKNFLDGYDDLIFTEKNTSSQSLFLPDEVMNRHPRFPTLTANIRERRGEKVCIQLPMYIDENTPETDDSVYERNWFKHDSEVFHILKKNHVYMDSMGFGMGSSCLQVTFQAPDLSQARFLYDSLNIFTPVLLSLSAAAPYFKGFLTDQDIRWNVISGAVDDRTPHERGVPSIFPGNENGGTTAKSNSFKGHIPKSRYSVVDLYLGGHPHFDESLNNTDVPINDKVYNRLINNEIFPMDANLARHFAHLFIRDPLVIFQEKVDIQNNTTDTDHFENIQSTNWQTLRFKPPTQAATPGNLKVPGWRVEFRPLEIQITDFENAAFSVFIYLLVECILTFPDSINTYIPMSEIWENMDTAHHRDSVLKSEFYWKSTFNDKKNFETQKASMTNIFNDKEYGIFNVFINRILKHKQLIANDWSELLEKHSSNKDLVRLYYYLYYIHQKSVGKIPSWALYLRNFVLNHKDYKKDSKVTEIINRDIIHLTEKFYHYSNKDLLVKFFGQRLGSYLFENPI